MMKVRNKRVMFELLEDGAEFEKVLIAEKLVPDELTKKILALAAKRGITIEYLPRWKMPTSRDNQEVNEPILGYLLPQKNTTIAALVAELKQRGEDPFFLLVNKVGFASNIGVIARSAYAAGVNGLIFQVAKDKFLNEDTIHYSMGAIARIPHIKMNVFEALEELQNNDITTFALDMDGEPYFKADLSGPAAFVLGAEREGISEKVLSRCSAKLAIPMKPGIDSLNVGVSASIILFEKVRQSLR